MDIIKGLFKEFGWFIGGMVALALLWYATGGYQSPTARGGQFIKPLAPLDSGTIYGSYREGGPVETKTKLDVPESPLTFIKDASTLVKGFFIPVPEKNVEKKTTDEPAASLLTQKLSFDGIAGAKKSNIHEEYIRIIGGSRADQTSLRGITLSGKKTDTAYTIPFATEILKLGETPKTAPVIASKDSRIIVSSGRSPVGASFRVNMCTGYLGQFQTFTPTLKKECPDPLVELSKTPIAKELACIDFVATIPRCEVYNKSFPANISNACKAFVTEKLSYNGCVTAYEKDTDFLTHEWRLFLNQSNELWDNKTDIIRLSDDKGRTIDALAY